MKKLRGKGLHVLKLFHLTAVICWLGGGFCMNSLLALARKAQSQEVLLYFYHIVDFIDMQIVAQAAMATVISGVIYGVWSHWGFFKHRWVIVKWVITVGVIGSGIVLTSSWLSQMQSLVSLHGLFVWEQVQYLQLFEQNMWLGWLQMALLLAAVGLSVFKPKMGWLKTNNHP